MGEKISLFYFFFGFFKIFRDKIGFLEGGDEVFL